jgi:hypothetical protein
MPSIESTKEPGGRMTENECVAERVTRYINSGTGTKYTVSARHIEEWSALAGSWIEARLREDPDFERYGSGLTRIPRSLRAELKHGSRGYAALVGDAYLAAREEAEAECRASTVPVSPPNGASDE